MKLHRFNPDGFGEFVAYRGLNCQPAVRGRIFGHRIHRVDDQVHQNLLNLNPVSADRQRGQSNGSTHINLPRNSLAGKKRNRLPDIFVKVDGFYLEWHLF